MPHASRVVSGIVGSPAPFENRTCARTGSPLKCAAFEIAPPASEAVKVARTARLSHARPGARDARRTPRWHVDQPVGEIPLWEIRSHAAPYASTVNAVPVTISTPEGAFLADVAGAAGAPLVLLLHGFPQSRFTWRDVMAPLAAAGLHAVAPDQRGYTPGVRPKDIASYATQRLVADVLDLADALGADTFHLVGHDWGGQVAWLTAADHPDRIETLTVLSRPHPAAFARSFALDPEQSDRTRHHRAMTPELTDRWWADDCAALRAMLDHAGVPASTIDGYFATFVEREALDAAMNWYRAAATEGGLRAVELPTSPCRCSPCGAPRTRRSADEPRS